MNWKRHTYYRICPECLENSILNINDYKIFLKCKNGHKVNDINFNEFQNINKKNISKIKCEECKIYNKSNMHNNLFYRCNKCKINICPICQLKHNKDHNQNIINYDKINYICTIHNKSYNSYCLTCNQNICMDSQMEHNNHEIKEFSTFMPNINELKEKNKSLKLKVNILKDNINNIINILNKTMENIEHYYSIINEINNSYDSKRINYEILKNIEEINDNNNIIKDIDEIINEQNIHYKFKKITNIYDKIMEKNEITIIYNNNKNINKINLFGKDFVYNNKYICKLIIEGNEYDI